MVAAVLSEVETFYYVPGPAIADAVITIFATSQAVAVVLFYMQLKDEPGSVKLFMVIPIMFLAGLLIAMLASLG